MLSVTQKFVAGFVTLIIGIMLVTTIAGTTGTSTTPITVYNETLDISSVKTIPAVPGYLNSTVSLQIANYPSKDSNLWKLTTDLTECLPGANGAFILKNGSYTTKTLNTDYTVSDTGIIHLLNTAAMNSTAISNTTYITYQYCPDSYITTSFGRTGINLIAGFFALALLIVSIGIFYSIAKDTDLI